MRGAIWRWVSVVPAGIVLLAGKNLMSSVPSFWPLPASMTLPLGPGDASTFFSSLMSAAICFLTAAATFRLSRPLPALEHLDRALHAGMEPGT